MAPSLILDPSDMQRPRSPSELLAWVMQKCNEFGATSETKLFARSGALLPKKFFDEIYPLALFAEREFGGRTDVTVYPSLDNDNFDGRILIGSAPHAKVLLVEVTRAKDGYDESLRLEVASREGSVSFTGPVTVSGRRGSANRRVHVEGEAVEHSTLVDKQLALVEQRLRAKSSVRYGENHVLVIAVDDYLALREADDVAKLREFADALLPRLKLDFRRVVFLGTAGKLFLSCDVSFRHNANPAL
jgi:hypothetical protein